jgi:triosephosphate isomerase
MPRRPLLAGNWKMHLTISEAKKLASSIAQSAADLQDRDVMIAPPFTALAPVSETLADSKVILAGQNASWAEQGAFTGDISPLMLKDAGCAMAILGHSERRHIFAESDEMINRRVKSCLASGLTPILCIGETLAEREAGETFKVLEAQLRLGLKEVPIKSEKDIIIAYEPVWAIGTGRTATAEQAQEVHAFVRNLLEDIIEKNIATGIRILYGGSVNAENVDLLMAQNDVDGALVGGAALNAESFDRIIHFQL